MLTFDPHPLAVIHPDALPKLLTTFPIKRDLIGGLGVEELVVIPFDQEFASRSAEQFVEEVLIGQLGAEQVSVGENFRFGKGARATPEFLASPRRVRDPRRADGGGRRGRPSPRPRSAAWSPPARWTRPPRFLGGPFLMEGEVVHGDRRGRELGMPTANIVPDDRLVVPGHGVYAAWAHGHPAAVNVGVRPTFETGRGLLVESHLIDFDGDLYGETLRVAFVERMRGERRFESADALVEQMWQDVDQAREICRAAATVSRR